MSTLNFKFELSGYVGVLKINSDLGLESRDGFKEAMKMSLALADHVVVNLEKVKELDISCLKVMCTAFKTSRKMKKYVTPVTKMMPSYKDKLECSGFCQNMCNIPEYMSSGNYDCLWVR